MMSDPDQIFEILSDSDPVFRFGRIRIPFSKFGRIRCSLESVLYVTVLHLPGENLQIRKNIVVLFLMFANWYMYNVYLLYISIGFSFFSGKKNIIKNFAFFLLCKISKPRYRMIVGDHDTDSNNMTISRGSIFR